MKWTGKEMRQMSGRDKAALAKDLTTLSEALQTDQSAGAALPTGTFWRLRTAAQDARRFLGRRRSR
jgi:hypothetical protein